MSKDLDEALSKIDNKLDEVTEAIHKVDKEVALQKVMFDARMEQNTDSLREHMAQTQLLKETIIKIDARLAPIEVDRIQAEAIKKYRNDKLKKYGKILGSIATVVGLFIATKPWLIKLLGL